MVTKIVNGIAISHFKKYPDRPTIVFLHDSLGYLELWRDLPNRLAEAAQCNVLVYDRLGYGKSEPMPTHERATNYMELEADVLNELLTQLEIENTILFGHSAGGTIAILTASKYPERVKAVIVEAAHIFVEDVTLKGIYEAMEAYKTTNLPERLAKYHNDKGESIFKAWTETRTRSDYSDWNIEHFLPKITCPLLFVQGDADGYGTLAHVEKTISQASGKAEKYIIPNVGHTPHKETLEHTFEASLNFIENLR